MLLRLLLIASSLYYSDAKKMHRSRVRQEWKVHCAKGESISGLTAQHVIDDVVATFACESLGHSSGSPAIQEGACRETKEFQVFKDGKLAPGGGESGCKSDEYVAGVRSSVSGKATKFERKLMFKCCKATNAEIDESSCHTVGPRHPFHVKRGEIVNLVNNAKKSGPSCPKYGLNAFLVDQNGFTLKYCLWKIKGAKYPESRKLFICFAF
uniref:Uncharacterized protein n=1 Tax=Plectus sambesii TaxID=2011161 RepID=A0A914UHU1_9BILA